MEFRLAEIAAHVGGTLEGDPERRLRGVSGLEEAGPDDISFLANRRYARLLRTTRAGAVLVNRAEPAHGRDVVRCGDPYLAFARVLELFHPRPRPTPGVHPLAVVEGDATGATVMAFAYVGPGAVVGEGTVLHPHVYVGAGARVGRDGVLMAGSVVADGCVLGDRVWLNPGAVVGNDGLGFVPTPNGLYKIPQAGRAVVGDDVELGANTNVDRAALGETKVGRGTKLGNLVQIGHGAEVGPDCLFVGYAGVAGSARLGRGVVLAARATVLGHLDVGDGVQVGALGVVTQDTPAGARRTGVPALDHQRWLEITAVLPDLPDLAAAVRRLTDRVATLEAAAASAKKTEGS